MEIYNIPVRLPGDARVVEDPNIIEKVARKFEESEVAAVLYSESKKKYYVIAVEELQSWGMKTLYYVIFSESEIEGEQ